MYKVAYEDDHPWLVNMLPLFGAQHFTFVSKFFCNWNLSDYIWAICNIQH